MHDLDKTSRITGERQKARQFVVPGTRGLGGGAGLQEGYSAVHLFICSTGSRC